jgi:hypothetical protein
MVQFGIIQHCNILLITLKGSNGPINLLNIYSDDDATTIQYLSDHVDEFPVLSYMGSNFNCPSSHWDPLLNNAHPNAVTLDDILTSLGLEQVAPIARTVTHVPYTGAFQGSIIDLVFVPAIWVFNAVVTVLDKGT